jgi:Protein of unknown function (DUF3352)
MTGMRKFLVLFAFAAVALPGCGSSGGSSGSGSGTIPETANFAPAGSAYFVSLDTDVTSDQWHKASVLLNRFPSSDELVKSFTDELGKPGLRWESDLKPALGPEVGLAGLGVNGDFVLFTKSPEPDELETILRKPPHPAVTKQLDGWVIAAEKASTLATFEKARKAGTLGDTSAFKDGISNVQTEGLALAYVPGTTIDTGAMKAAQGQPLSSAQITKAFGKVQSLAASASAEAEGVRFDVTGTVDNAPSSSAFEPTLDEALPAKPILFLDLSGLGNTLRQALDAYQQQDPSFARQRSEVEKALGLTLNDDVFPVLDNESAVGIYRAPSATSLPVTIDVAVKADEAKATKLMERVGALLELGGSGKASTVDVNGLHATELTLTGQDISVLWAVIDGKLLLSTSRAGMAALHGSSHRLAEDSAYTDALGAADVPSKVSLLAYSDLQTAVPFFIQAGGSSVDAETLANLKPLRSVVASATRDGDSYLVSGFVGIG